MLVQNQFLLLLGVSEGCLGIVFSEQFPLCSAVILSNYYDLPFNDILNWRKFSLILNERDVYRLKYILKNVSDSEFITLHYNLVKVNSPCLVCLIVLFFS